jgi:hypothetical protein
MDDPANAIEGLVGDSASARRLSRVLIALGVLGFIFAILGLLVFAAGPH